MDSPLDLAPLANLRYEPCTILRARQVPYVIWFEDALHCYLVRTGMFQLYLLVENLNQAAEALVQAGWTLQTLAAAKIGHAQVDSPQRRLLPPEPDETRIPPVELGAIPASAPEMPPETVLLQARDWYFDLSTGATIPTGTQICIPRLPNLLDSLLEAWMEDAVESSSLLWSRLAVLIGYLYTYNPCVKSLDLTKHLKYEHRQYHIDALSGNFERGTMDWYRHQKIIRNALRTGRWQLTINSSRSADLDALGATEPT